MHRTQGAFMEEQLLIQSNESDDIYQEILKDNYNRRRFIINQNIDDDLLEYLVLSIIKINQSDRSIPKEHRKKIYIYINSDGGDAIMGTQILGIIKASITPIVTIGLAKCASMASYILASGHERYCFDNTVVLYHDGQAGYVSSGNKGKDIQKFYDRLNERLDKFMIENTLMTNEYLEEIKDREYYIFGSEAKEMGIVDKVIGVDCSLEDIL